MTGVPCTCVARAKRHPWRFCPWCGAALPPRVRTRAIQAGLMLRAGHSWDEVGRVLFGRKQQPGKHACLRLRVDWERAGSPGGPGPYPPGPHDRPIAAVWRAACQVAFEAWLRDEAERELQREADALAAAGEEPPRA
jgi:hypothetical protein